MALKEVWITAAKDDAEAQDAVLLALSLRRSMTGKKIVVIYGPSVSTELLTLLYEEFDVVLPSWEVNADEKNLNALEFEELVKIHLHKLRLFQRGIFLSPSVLALNNMDVMFESLFESPVSQVLWEGEREKKKLTLRSPVFAVLPSTSKSTFSSLKAYYSSSTTTDYKQDIEEIEALQAKAMRLFSYSGMDLSKVTSSEEANNVYEKLVSLVKMPSTYSQSKNISDQLKSLGKLSTVIMKCLDDIQRKLKLNEECGKVEKIVNIPNRFLLFKLEFARKGGNKSVKRVVPLEKMEEEPIAIIGMACRLPASNNVEEFWNLMMSNGEAVSTVPKWRWLDEQVKKMTAEAREAKGGFLKCPVDEFDGKFFGMSPKELEFTDPQARLLLEVSWEALEDAAVDANSLKGTQTGIFTGTWLRDYADIMNKTGCDESLFFRSYMGNGYGATAGRMAHFYGTTGSNIATESGCSSSIVAVGLACNSLRRKKTPMALACGVNLLLQPYEKDAMISFCAPDGVCKTFDEGANGFGRAEGVGVLVLKRLSDAVADGDNIRAVIRGYGEAQEGVSRSLGTPTVEVEALAMSLALKDAQVEPREVDFVEAHGTGTAVGDPMEMEAIAQVYSRGREQPLLVTSVKTNVGHTESCSGITGMMKAVLALEREVIPPHRALNSLNPKIDLSKTPARIPLEPTPWPKSEKRRRIAGVSSFGISGTDAHVILEEAPSSVSVQCDESASFPLTVLALSARNEASLKQLFEKYEQLAKSSEKNWIDVAYTANTGRAHFPEFRGAIVATDLADAARQLERQSVECRQCPQVSQRSKVVFLFTGQGSQYVGMAKEIYNISPEFKRQFDRCDGFLKKNYKIDIKPALWESTDSNLLQQTLYSQTAIFVVDFCLAELWASWGVRPDVVVGHSLGEYAAACVAGIVRLEDALKLVAERSRLIDALPTGKMIVVNVDINVTRELIKKSGASVEVAAMNSPDQTTLAGREASVLAFKKFCDNNGVKSHVLDASHAFHSEMMDPALPALRKVAQSINYKPPTCTFVSGMEGVEMTSIDAEYWVRHTRLPVNFTKACETLRNDVGMVCVEVGPQPILSSFIARNLNVIPPTLLPSLRRNQSDWKTLMESLARLYTAGHDVNWKGFFRHVETSKVSGLPTYPFQRKKFWFEKPKNDGLLFSGNQLHPLVNFRFPSASSTKTFQSRVSLEKETYVRDHQVGSHVIFPGAGYVEMVLAAGYSATLAEFEDFRHPTQPICLRDLRVEAPLGMAEKEVVHLQTIVAPPDVNDTSEDANNWNSVTIHRRQEDASGTKSWVRHASAKFSSFFNDTSAGEIIDVDGLKDKLSCEETGAFYEKLGEVGLNFGESFRSLRRLWKGTEKELLAEIAVPQGSSYLSHPVAIDAMIQTLMASKEEQLTQLMVPVQIDHFHWIGNSPETAETEAKSTSLFVYVDGKSPNTSAVLVDASGKKLAVMTGVTLVPTSAAAIDNALQSQKLVLPQLLEEEWVPAAVNSFTPRGESCVPSKFLESPGGVDLLNFEKNQGEPADEEIIDMKLSDELTALQALQAFLEMGWIGKVGEIIDVRQLATQMKIPPSCLLVTRRFFEIIGRYTKFLEGSDWTFHVKEKLPSIAEVEIRISEIEKSVVLYSVEVECIRSVASKTAAVLRGQDSVLPVLFGEGRYAEKVYTEFSSAIQGNELLAETVRCVCNELREKNRLVRILEIGGGTGGSTRSVLPVLEESGVDFSYTFTDVSSAFFPLAETAFVQSKERMEFKVLDIEKDPKSQGFIQENFDIVIASHVLHATRVMKETMANVRHLLRPNGLALIVEAYEPLPGIDSIFGLVDGYWIFEDFDLRPYHCIVPEASWPKLLSSTGFCTPKLLKVRASRGGIICAQATSGSFDYSLPASHQANTWIVANDSSDEEFQKELTSQLERNGRRVVHFESDVVNLTTKLMGNGSVEGILFGCVRKNVDISSRIVDQLESARKFLGMIQSILASPVSKAPKFFLVTEGSVVVGDDSAGSPFDGTLWGMSRSFRSENLNFSCVNVDVDPNDTFEENAASLVRLLWSAKDDFIAVREKKKFVAKLKRWKLKNTALPLPQDVPRFGLILPKTNAINDLQFGAQGCRDVVANQVEVELKAAALNFKDLLCVLRPSKEFEKNAAVGTDMAGVVTAVGKDARNLKVGDRVFGAFFNFGGLPSHIVVPEDVLAKIPERLTFSDASTLPAVFTTAYFCLIDVAQLKKGETILIHTASGGVGLAAIQVAKDVGAKVIATAGSRRKRIYLKEVMGIEDIFHSRDLTYEEDILRVTEGRGVDVVLNSLTGPGFKEATLNVCSKNGRFVEMSKLNVWSESDVKQMRHDVDYKIVDLTTVSSDTWKHLLREMEDFLTRGALFPLPHETFEAVEIRGALTHLQKARHIGKIVCKMPESGGERRHLLFNERSSYLITGGLGGIGLEAAKWMASEGAKFLVLAGRSLPSEKATKVISELNAMGKVVVAVQVDVGKWEECRNLVERINNGQLSLDGMTFPPLRGIQHAAGCLSDGMFPNQTWEKYEETFNGKVKGAWNLHQLTKNASFPLEHFVTYSSMASAFGAMGQSNHAAGNAFLDTLTHFRNARGLPATSVNWGQWGQIGVAADLNLNFCAPFTPLQGFSSLKEMLRNHKSQAVVFEGELSQLRIFFSWVDREGYAKAVQSSSSHSATQDKHALGSLTPEKFWEDVEGAKGLPKETELVIQKLLIKVVSHILKMEQSEGLDLHQNLQEMGMDSLMTVELKNLLQGILGSKVTLTAGVLQEANTIHKLGKKLREMILEGDELSEDDKVQLILSEAALPDGISGAEIATNVGSLRGNGGGAVDFLVRGAVTSQLGLYLVENLSRWPNVRNVVILSSEDLRTSLISQLSGNEMRIDMSKCRVISVDEESSERLGLSVTDYERLASEIDGIVDVRLSTSKDESSSGIKKEAQDTKSLLEFAAQKKLKFVCHVTRVLPQRKSKDVQILDENLPYVTQEDLQRYGDRGYSSSQFVSECLLREAAERGIPCRVFRVPHLSGDSLTGRFQLTEGHIFVRYIEFLIAGQIPAVAVPFAVVPVNQAAELILRVFVETPEDGDGSLVVFNLSNPHEYSFNDFFEVSKELGRPVRAVELEEFLADKNSLVETVTFTFGDPLEFSKENSAYSKLAEASSQQLISCGNLRKVVDNLEGQVETPLAILRRDLKFAQDSGLFQRFTLTQRDSSGSN